MTKTDLMISHLARGSANAATLAMQAQLPNSGRVYALLKTNIERGRVLLRNGRYRLNPDWDEQMQSELRDARILLERAGYRVTRGAA